VSKEKENTTQTGKLEKLRGLEGSRAEDHLPLHRNAVLLSSADKFDRSSSVWFGTTLKEHLCGLGAGEDDEVRAGGIGGVVGGGGVAPASRVRVYRRKNGIRTGCKASCLCVGERRRSREIDKSLVSVMTGSGLTGSGFLSTPKVSRV
jgi:hypothetical protein